MRDGESMYHEGVEDVLVEVLGERSGCERER
jgi:hypothetical protein